MTAPNTAVYTITLSNSAGMGAATGGSISDVLPSGFTYASNLNPVYAGGATGPATISNSGTAATPVFGTPGGDASNSFTLPGGGSVSITLNVDVGAGVPPGTYQNPARADYTDPTRTATGQTVTPGATYASGGGTAGGSNYDPASSTGEDVRIIAPLPALTIVKTAAPGTYSAVGQVISYSYLVTNSGNVNLNGPFSVSDDRAADETCPATATLAPGDSITCAATYTITQADLDAGSVTNTASASGVFGGNPVTSSPDSETVTAVQSPALTIVKSATPGTYGTVGQVINYSYLVTNSGNVTLSGPFTVADDRAADEACPATASLAPGDSITCGASYTITQADLNAGSVTNIASASGSFGGSPVTSPTDTETVTAVQSPALTLLKSITAGSPYDSVGDIVNYAFLVTNSGNISLAGPVTVADNRATDESCPSVNTVGNLDAFLDPGEAITCIASYTVTQTDLNVGSVTNTASASADGTTSNSDSETAVATQTPSIGLVKEVSVDGGLSWVDANTPPGPSLSSGTDPQFRFTVTNLGNVTLTGLTLIDSDFSTASCTIPASLAPGASFSCTLTAAWASGPHTNTATAAGRLGAVVASDSDDANYTGAAAAISDPAVTKTGDPATAVVGDIVTFTVVVTNAGTANADNVVLTDPVPAFLNIVNVAVAPLGPTPSIVGNTITVPFGTLTPGQTFTVTITTVVNSLGTPPGGTNSATVSTTSAESDPGNNASSALTTIVAATGFGAPATGFAPDRVSRMPAQPDNKRYLDLGDLWLEIPALGLELPIVGVPITDEGWDVTWLGRQAGWLNGTAFPTWEGNSVLTAHVTMASGRAGPFRALKNLRWDDSIIIHYAGQRYVYSVRRAASVSPTDPLITRHEERAWLTLVTCQDYDDGTGEYLRRTIVRAVLTAIEPEP